MNRPAHAVHFAVYEAAKKGLGETVAETSFAGAAAAGAAATIVSDACMTPFDVIKQRLQVGAATPRTSEVKEASRLDKYVEECSRI